MYMSYCRFEGTNNELVKCLSDVEEHIYGEASYKVSDNEIEYFKKMTVEFFDFLKDNYLVTQDGELDGIVLDRICEAMAKAYPDEEEW